MLLQCEMFPTAQFKSSSYLSSEPTEEELEGPSIVQLTDIIT